MSEFNSHALARIATPPLGTAEFAQMSFFLTTASENALFPILRQYGQPVDRKKNQTDPFGPYSHPVRIYLIDRNQSIRNIYSTDLLDPFLVSTDIRTVLLSEKEGS